MWLSAAAAHDKSRSRCKDGGPLRQAVWPKAL
jgi:hypothetical protein